MFVFCWKLAHVAVGSITSSHLEKEPTFLPEATVSSGKERRPDTREVTVSLTLLHAYLRAQDFYEVIAHWMIKLFATRAGTVCPVSE